MADNDVVEGFLCPNCHRDLGSVQGLVDHVSSNACTNISSASSMYFIRFNFISYQFTIKL